MRLSCYSWIVGLLLGGGLSEQRGVEVEHGVTGAWGWRGSGLDELFEVAERWVVAAHFYIIILKFLIILVFFQIYNICFLWCPLLDALNTNILWLTASIFWGPLFFNISWRLRTVFLLDLEQFWKWLLLIKVIIVKLLGHI